MLFRSLLLILTACAIGFTSAVVTPHSLVRRSSRHKALQPNQKRASGQFTYFAVGMGACGKQNTDNDFVSNSAFVFCVSLKPLFAEQIVALNTPVDFSLPYLIRPSLTILHVWTVLGGRLPLFRDDYDYYQREDSSSPDRRQGQSLAGLHFLSSSSLTMNTV